MTKMRVPPASVYFPPEDRAVILQQIDECLATGQLTLGKLGRQLEERFAAYLGVDHAVTVNSGTSAIEIPLRAIGVEGKEVLVAADTFSFYPTKVMAGGEGGIIVTDDERIADEARIYRDQGKASFLTNLHTRLGYNWRMSEPHAAIALSQFGRLDEFIAHRQHVAARYDEALTALPLTPLPVGETSRCNYYKYIAFLPDGVDRPRFKRSLP